MTPRDKQRAKVYDAEQLVRGMFERADESVTRQVEIAGSTLTLPTERKFASIESVQRYVTAVLALNWVRARWPNAVRPIHVRERGGNAAAHYEPATATLAVPLRKSWALRELVMLHEVAHHLGEPDEEPHGPEYVSRYLELVGEIVGQEAQFVLRVMLAECGAAVARRSGGPSRR